MRIFHHVKEKKILLGTSNLNLWVMQEDEKSLQGRKLSKYTLHLLTNCWHLLPSMRFRHPSSLKSHCTESSNPFSSPIPGSRVTFDELKSSVSLEEPITNKTKKTTKDKGKTKPGKSGKLLSDYKYSITHSLTTAGISFTNHQVTK